MQGSTFKKVSQLCYGLIERQRKCRVALGLASDIDFMDLCGWRSDFGTFTQLNTRERLMYRH